MRRFQNVGVLLALCLLLPLVAAAQETTGSISGTVVTADGKGVARAKVSVSSARGTREVATDEQGRFLVAFLNPGSYTVDVTAEGYQAIKDEGVVVALGQRLARRYVVSAMMEESVEAIAPPAEQARPTIDLTSQSTGASISTEVAEQLPIARNISAVVFLAPGVKSGGGTGNANPSISGSSGLENQYVFDGVNVTNAGYGALGSYSIIHGSQGTGINFNFVQETQVITGGLAAEYGQATGGIVNVVTKSGSNEWDGEIFGNWTPAGLESSRSTPDLTVFPIAPTTGQSRLDYGADISGPIAKDHVFFYVGINPVELRTTRKALPQYGLSAEGPITRVDKTLDWAAKFTFQLNPDHKIDVSAFGDPTESNNTFTRGSSALRAADRGQFSKIQFGYDNYAVKYQGQVNPNFLISATFGRSKNTFEETFAPQFNKNRLSDVVGLQLGTSSSIPVTGGIGYFENNESTNDQVQFKFTNIVKNHEIKYGLNIERIGYVATTDRTGTPYTTRFGETTTTGSSVSRRIDTTLDPTVPGTETVIDPSTGQPVAVVYRVVRTLLSDPAKDTKSDYDSAFIQDDWSITPNVHFNFGVRWERQSIEGSLVKNTFPAEWSPRFGLSWDPLKDGRSKVYGQWGRVFEKIPLDMAVRVFSPEVGISRGTYYDENLTRPVGPVDRNDPGLGRYYIEQTSSVSGVVEGTRNSYTDALVLGYQQALGANERWKVTGEFQQRTLGRGLEDMDLSVDPTVCDELIAGTRQIGNINDIYALLLPGSDQVLTGAAVDCGYLVGNPRDADTPGVGSVVAPKREYIAGVFEVERQADDRWYMKIQYVLSSLRGNYEGLFRNDNGQSDPNLTSLWDFANEPAFYETYSTGPLNTDRTHRLQAFGFHNWENGWSLGSRFLMQTGVPKLALASHPIYENGGEVQLEPRGANGRTPTEWYVDLNFGKKFKLQTAYESNIELTCDVTNLFNKQFPTSFDFDVDSGTDLQYDDYATYVASVANGIPNPDYNKSTSYSTPRQVRFGVRWKF